MVLLPTFVYHAVGRHAAQLHDKFKLLLLVVARKYGLTSIKFGQDTPETPNINFFGVFDPENDLWGPVESGLDISIDLFISEAP